MLVEDDTIDSEFDDLLKSIDPYLEELNEENYEKAMIAFEGQSELNKAVFKGLYTMFQKFKEEGIRDPFENTYTPSEHK